MNQTDVTSSVVDNEHAVIPSVVDVQSAATPSEFVDQQPAVTPSDVVIDFSQIKDMETIQSSTFPDNLVQELT